MSDTMTELEMTVSRTIPASREKVFNAWLSPATLARFMVPCEGGPYAKVKNDPVKGGSFSIVMVTEDNREIPHSGTYLEVDPHARLAFTWASEYSLDDSRVTVDFAERGPKATEITLRQVKFRSEETRDAHVGGWTVVLTELEKMLG